MYLRNTALLRYLRLGTYRIPVLNQADGYGEFMTTLLMLFACLNFFEPGRRLSFFTRRAHMRILPPVMTTNGQPRRASLKDMIQAQVKLSDVVRLFGIFIEERGENKKARCPFHADGKEKTPSMSINDKDGKFHCFSCKESGDLIEFVRKHEELTFKEALGFLAENFGVEGEVQDSYRKRLQSPVEDGLIRVHEAATNAYCEALRQQAAAPCAHLLRERGVTHQAASRFRLGFSPGGKWLTTKLVDQGYSRAQLLAAGLSVSYKADGQLYDRWCRRANPTQPIAGH